MTTLINVSNRLPVTVTDDGSIKKSSGGLVAALEGLPTDRYQLRWIGWPGGDVPPETRVETGTAGGVYLALLATAAMFVGALFSMRDERLSKGGRLTDQTGKPVDRAPEAERLATP